MEAGLSAGASGFDLALNIGMKSWKGSVMSCQVAFSVSKLLHMSILLSACQRWMRLVLNPAHLYCLLPDHPSSKSYDSLLWCQRLKVMTHCMYPMPSQFESVLIVTL